MDSIDVLKQEFAECRHREAELSTQLEDLQDFIENAAIPLHWVNGSGIITWANQEELDLLGYPRDEYIGSHISNFYADKAVSEDILSRLIDRQTLTNYPAVLKCRDGSYRDVLINSNARWDGDRFVHTRCFTRDVSDIKRAEEANRRLVGELRDEISSLREENDALRAMGTLLKPGAEPV